MLILDTDHLSELLWHGPQSSLGSKLRNAREPVVLTIVSAEEALRGWLALIARIRDPAKQIDAYSRLQRTLRVLHERPILAWDDAAADNFRRLRREGVGIGTMDLKIACIALAHGATLLTRNLVDFREVPGLAVEDWLAEV